MFSKITCNIKLSTVACFIVAITIIVISAVNILFIDNFWSRHFGNEVSNFVHLRLQYWHTSNESQEPALQFKFQVYSHNVRVDTRNRFPHEQSWWNRRDSVVKSIRDLVLAAGGEAQIPSLVGLQEVKHHQLNDILRRLNSEESEEYPWKHYGVGRDDGDTLGEYTPVIYNASEWILVNGTSRWLSKNPNTPGRAWGAATKRVITFTTFQNKQTGDYVNFINTHLDHKSEHARKKSCELIVDWIKSIPNDYVTVLTGDFNSFKDGAAYKEMALVMLDSYEVSISEGKERNTGDTITYTGFENDSPHTLIDFQWFKETTKWSVLLNYFKTITNENEGLRFSDHKPLVGIYEVRKQGLVGIDK